MTGKHSDRVERGRNIMLTKTECEVLIAALRVRHTVIIDDMWDSGGTDQAEYCETQLLAIVSAVGKLWVDHQSRRLAQDAEHVLRDVTENNIREFRKSTGYKGHGSLS